MMIQNVRFHIIDSKSKKITNLDTVFITSFFSFDQF